MNNLQQLLSAAALVVVSNSICAEETRHQFNIPAQNLGSALQKLAAQSGVSIFYASDSVAGRKAQALKGQYTTNTALNQLLSGSGLVFNLAADGSISVKPAPVQLNQSNPTTLQAVSVTADAVYDAKDPYNEDYVLPNATTGTKTDTPIMETPLNVQVISKQVLKDQQVIRLDQALRNVSGVTSTKTSNGGLDDEFNLRGFNTQTQFRNGIRLDIGTAAGTRQFANVESIEVLKGPAAILYGRVEPGGIVNIVTKQPLATPYYSFNQQFGSYDVYRTSIDATGPLTKDDTLLYRMNMSYENSGSWRDLVDTKQFFFAPTLKWNISPRTQATLEVEFSHGNTNLDFQYLPFVDNKFLNLSRKQSLTERSPTNTDNIVVALNWSHQFNDDWSVKHQILTRHTSMHSDATFVQNFDIANNLAQRYRYVSGTDDDTFATVLDLTGHFETLGLKHTLLMGGDYYRWDWTSLFSQQSGFDADFNFVDPSNINIYQPVHPGTPPINQLALQNFDGFTQITDNYGLYAQDQIKLPYHVHIMGGLRYQYVHTTLTAPSFDQPAQTDDAVTPRVGILWQPQPWLSVYGNYVENFGANSGRGFLGKPLPPQSAQQWEVGAKTEFFNGRLRATLAYYDLTKQNLATQDRDPTHECGGGGFGSCQIAVGAVRSRGPEVDIQGEIVPGWNVIATYANQDVRISKSNDTADSGSTNLVGNRLPFVPRNTGSVWSTFEVQQGELKGFKIGGGVNLQDGVVDYSNSLKSTGYALVGLMTGYNFKVGKSKITAQLNVDNLLDKSYFTNANVQGNVGYVTFSTPRTFMGSINVQF